MMPSEYILPLIDLLGNRKIEANSFIVIQTQLTMLLL